MRNGQFVNGSTNPLGDPKRVFGVGIRKNKGELLTAVSRRKISRTLHGFFDQTAQSLQTLIAFHMTIGIVEGFEVVYVDEHQ